MWTQMRPLQECAVHLSNGTMVPWYNAPTVPGCHTVPRSDAVGSVWHDQERVVLDLLGSLVPQSIDGIVVQKRWRVFLCVWNKPDR